MSAAPARPFRAVASPSGQDAPVGRGLSPGFGAGTLAGMVAGRPFDLDRFRRVFPDRWTAFLHAHFRSHAQVQFFFSVDEKTARNWWNGVGAPRAEFAVVALAAFPASAPAFLLPVAA